MLKSKVAIIKGNAYSATKKALKLTGFKKFIKNKKRIVIKPNLTTPEKAEKGITTDVNVVRAILDFIPKSKEIVIAEGPGASEAEEAFEANDYYELKKDGIKFIDTNNDSLVEVKVKSPLSLKRVRMSKTVFNSDFLISVGKLKIHSIAKVTGTLKNMMGACPREQKGIIHAFVPISIVDLIKIKKPDFGVIDGIVANEIDEVVPSPIKMGIIIAGKDCVALDSVVSRIMGIEPNDVYYIKKIGEDGFGTTNMNDIEIVGEKIEKISKNFRRRFVLRSETERLAFKLLLQTGLYEPSIPIIRKVRKILSI